MNNNSRLFFVLMSAGAAIGIGNMWLYPYFSFKFSGLFFIPYMVALLALGVPLLMLEFSAGQYFNKNVVDMFASIRKWFSSIGWLMVFNAFVVMSLYAVVLAWHIIYLFVSFGMQWKHDAKEYFFGNVVQISNGFMDFTKFSLPVFIALIIAWVVLFFFIRKGFESMKKSFLTMIPILIFLMLLFIVYSLSLDNALHGVYSFVKPEFGGLLNIEVWINSFYLAVLSLALAFGVMHAFARKGEKGFIVGNSFVVVISEILVSIAVGFIVFGILGFLSMNQTANIESLAFPDFGSSFTTLAQALPLFYKPTFFSILFFIFLSIFFMLGAASLAYSISHVLVHKFNTKHRSAAIIVSGFGFLFGFLFIIKPGFYIMDIINHFIYYNILISVLLEVLAVGWFFDTEKISNHINQYSVLKIGRLWEFMIRYVAPLILLSLLFFQIKSDFLLDYKGYPLLYILIFGIGIVVVPIIAAFLMPQRILDRK